jgi:hypothetical protein
MDAQVTRQASAPGVHGPDGLSYLITPMKYKYDYSFDPVCPEE